MSKRDISILGTNGLVASGSERVADNTLVFTFTAPTQVGDRLLLAISCDNLSTTTPTVSSVVDSRSPGSNLWAAILNAAPNASSNTAAAAVVLRCWRLTVSVAHQIGDTVTLTLSASVTAKAGGIMGVRGVGANLATGVVSSQGVNGTSPSLNVSPGGVGDIVIGILATENNSVSTGDTDTLNGSWSTPIGVATSGTAASQVAITMQAKIVTSTGQQTFSAPATNDWAAVAFTIAREVVPDIQISGAWFEGPVPKNVGKDRISFAAFEAPTPLYVAPADVIAPVRQSVTVIGNVLTILYDEKLQATNPATGLGMKINGTEIFPTSVAITSNKVTATYPTSVVNGDVVTLTYYSAFIAVGNRIKDVAGNQAAGFSAVSVTNLTPSLGSEVDIWEGAVYSPYPLEMWNGTEWIGAPLEFGNGTVWAPV